MKKMRIIVCLTTIPSRLPLIQPTIESLLQQTLPPDKIYLFLPKFSKKENRPYPPLTFHPPAKLVVVEPDDDYGPMTKFYPIFLCPESGAGAAAAKNAAMVVVDDDRIYHPTTIQRLVEESSRHPGCLLGFSGWIIGHHIPSWTKVKFGKNVECDWLEATNAMLFPLETVLGTRQADNLKRDLLRFKELGCPEAKYCDDIWVSGWWKEYNPEGKVICVSLPTTTFVDHEKTAHSDLNALHTGQIDANTVSDRHQSIYQRCKGAVNCLQRNCKVASYLKKNVYQHALRTKDDHLLPVAWYRPGGYSLNLSLLLVFCILLLLALVAIVKVVWNHFSSERNLFLNPSHSIKE